MKHILLFGAGRSATVLIDHLKYIADQHVWRITVADHDEKLVQEKVGDHPLTIGIAIDIQNDTERSTLIAKADVVISLMPPALHHLIAKDCVQYKKHLLTASYVDDAIRQLENEINANDLLFLCEMGLDPGIDHMSAMKIIHGIQKKGGKITAFRSHCGGLVAPESDTNPWHYKISWNPKNIILAGKAGAIFKENERQVFMPYTELFDASRTLEYDGTIYAYYPNRDSSAYAKIYGLEAAHTFVRTTLRHPEFCFGWKNIIDLKLTDEFEIYDTDGMTIASFFRTHLEKNGFSNWLNEMLMQRLSLAKEMMEKLMELMEAEEQAKEIADSETDTDELMLVDEKGELSTVYVDDVKDRAAETVAFQMHEANLSMKQLFFLGLDDETPIDQGKRTAAEVLQFILEKKLALQPGDKDMIVMLHEIEYELNGAAHEIRSGLTVIGDDDKYTAMAKTVGSPLGIAAELLLLGKIPTRGLRIPIVPEIYEPVLQALADQDIIFKETERTIS